MFSIVIDEDAQRRQVLRASWKGQMRIGGVTLPVKLYGATRSSTPHFIQLHAKDLMPVQRVTVCSKDGEELSDSDVVRAVEYEGKYVVLSDSELERQAGFERDIIVRQITDTTAIDPMYYSTPYYIVPGRGGELAYAIFRQAFERMDKVAIASFLFYGRERLSAIASRGGVMHLQILRFNSEIVPQSEIDISALPQPAPTEVTIASQLLGHYTSSFHAGDYRNRQDDLLNDLVQRKALGLPLKKPPKIESGTTPEDQVVGEIEKMLRERNASLL